MRRTVLILLMLLAVTVATAHEERRWPAWLSAGQDDAVRTVANTQGAISQTTLLTTFSRIYNPTAVSISIYNAINALYGLKILILIAAGLQIQPNGGISNVIITNYQINV